MEPTRFSFRPITRSDKAAVLALSAKIWDGGDYIPSAFDAWVEDKSGLFNGCFVGHRLIGLGKVSFLAPGHAWLEGLRKDPDCGESGVGRALCLDALRYLSTVPGLLSIRFSAYAHNPATIALNEAIGFRRVDVYTVKSKHFPGAIDDNGSLAASGEAEDGSSGRVLLPADAGACRVGNAADRQAVLEGLKAEGFFARYRLESWKAYPLDAVPALWPSDGALEAIFPDGGSAGYLAYSVDPLKRQLNILGLSAKDETAAAALLLGAEEACRSSGFKHLEAIVPKSGRSRELLAACGYVSWETEDDFLLYEWPAERLGESPPRA